MAQGKERKFTQQDLIKIKFLKTAGCNNRTIAKVMDCSHNTLFKHCKELLQTCNAELNGIVCANLFKQTRNNPGAAIFWMKCRAGWSTQFTAVDPEDGEKITIQLVKGKKPTDESCE